MIKTSPYLFYDTDRPATSGIREAIYHEIENQLESIKLRGIEQIKVGMEFEFHILPEPTRPSPRIELAKNDLGLFYKQRYPNGAKRAFNTFLVRDVLLGQMYRTFADWVEPRFGGKQHEGKKWGFYDGFNQEIRLKPCSIPELLNRRDCLLKYLATQLSDFGYQPEEFYFECRQPSISFWTDADTNICQISSLQNKYHIDLLATLATGLMNGIWHSLAATYSTHHFNDMVGNRSKYDYSPTVDISPGRMGYIRTAGFYSERNRGRFEIRKPENFGADFDREDFDLLMLSIVSGIRYALDRTYGTKRNFLNYNRSFIQYGYGTSLYASQKLFNILTSTFITATDQQKFGFLIKPSHIKPTSSFRFAQKLGRISEDLCFQDADPSIIKSTLNDLVKAISNASLEPRGPKYYWG